MNLRDMREAAGLTVTEAAAKAGVSQSTVTRSERGRVVDGVRTSANLPLATVTTLLRVYGDERLAELFDAVPGSLKSLRERAGYTRAELADGAEAPRIYTARAVQAIELGTSKPTVEQIASFCMFLGEDNAGAMRVADMLTELVEPVQRHANKPAK